jgi:hypothetical protein
VSGIKSFADKVILDAIRAFCIVACFPWHASPLKADINQQDKSLSYGKVCLHVSVYIDHKDPSPVSQRKEGMTLYKSKDGRGNEQQA